MSFLVEQQQIYAFHAKNERIRIRYRMAGGSPQESYPLAKVIGIHWFRFDHNRKEERKCIRYHFMLSHTAAESELPRFYTVELA